MSETAKETTPTTYAVPNDKPQPQSHGVRWWLDRSVTPLLLLIAGIILIAGVGAAQRLGWISAGGTATTRAGEQADSIHTCPMHPQIRQPDMDDARSAAWSWFRQRRPTEEASTNFRFKSIPRNVASPTSKREATRFEPVLARINTVGAIAIDESRMSTIASYIDGRIERMFADYTGVSVAKGDHLVVIYSPELYSAQVEYLENRKSFAGNPSGLDTVRQAQQKFVTNARRKLQELGLTEAQIRKLESTGKAESRQAIYSPMGGTVTEKLAVEGKYVKVGEPIYRIADLSTVWLKLELYPDDASRIRFGQLVEAQVTSIPAASFKAGSRSSIQP